MGYLHNRGDYGRYRGDPGILDVFRKIAGTAIGIVGGMAPGPAGSVLRQVSTVVKPSRAIARPAPIVAMPAMPRFGPTVSAPVTVNAAGEVVRKRRRMNVTNSKALRRAIRRTDGFVKLAKRALKGTGYTVSRRGSGRTRPQVIVESGPGSVVSR